MSTPAPNASPTATAAPVAAPGSAAQSASAQSTTTKSTLAAPSAPAAKPATKPAAKPITIATIAREAGVSVATVSKVLNGKNDVSQSTKDHVESVISAHNYKRRPSKASRSQLIELVIHELDSAWSSEIIQAVEAQARDANLSLVLSDLRGEVQVPRELMDSIVERQPIGVILVMATLDPAQVELLKARSIPLVVLDTYGEEPVGVASIGSDNWSGGYAATRHLTDLGHKRIAVISGPNRFLSSRARVDGYRGAIDGAGLEIDKDLIRWGDFYLEGGYAHALELLALSDPPTAIFAGSDMQALGVMRAAKELGLRIPQDLSVVGYDNIPLTEWLDTRLTTISQSLRTMGASATEMLLTLAEGGTLIAPKINLSTELIVRESTAPPAS